MIRQGDILLVQAITPSGYGKLATDQVVVGNGEVTGHTHTLSNATWLVTPETTQEHLREFADGKIMNMPIFVVAGEGSMLTHQEHAPLSVPPGTWRVIRQREYAPEAIRSVLD